MRRSLLPFAFAVIAGDASASSLVDTAKAAANPEIDFASRYSSSMVGCGTDCVSYWFVDRRGGKVISAPNGARPDQSILSMKTTAHSTIVELIYEPRGDLPGPCAVQSFRFTGRNFVALTPQRAVRCPA